LHFGLNNWLLLFLINEYLLRGKELEGLITGGLINFQIDGEWLMFLKLCSMVHKSDLNYLSLKSFQCQNLVEYLLISLSLELQKNQDSERIRIFQK
jgi:hypothetical protein